MEILHVMVPVAILLVVGAIVVFFWAVRNGQFDDLERQGYNILLDDKKDKNTRKKKSEATSDKPTKSVGKDDS